VSCLVKQVNIYTDGACSGNPGPGGWGVILDYRGHARELSGGEPETTNNRMEIMTVIKGLEALKEPCRVTIHTDSRYVTDAIRKGWAKRWRAKNWMRGENTPALNSDLWSRVLQLLDKDEVEIRWVRGHAGHPQNERCDTLAREAIERVRREHRPRPSRKQEDRFDHDIRDTAGKPSPRRF